MKRLMTAAIAAALITVTVPAQARNDRLTSPIADAMSTADAKARLDGSVKFYFSGQKAPGAKHTYGTFTANKKANGLNKSDKGACEWAFMPAMLALQTRALCEGGNALVDIHSLYRNNDFESATEDECGVGTFVAGVTLRGTVVKLP